MGENKPMTLKEIFRAMDNVAVRNIIGEISQEEADQLYLELNAKYHALPDGDFFGKTNRADVEGLEQIEGTSRDE